MKKIYLHSFFRALSPCDSIPLQELNADNNCDIIGITFYNNQWQKHSEILEQLLPKTKKLLVYLSEPTTGIGQTFLEFLQQWDVPNVYTFSDAVINDNTVTNFSTSISWFIHPLNFYSSRWWAIKRIGKLSRTFSKPYLVDCLLGTEKNHRTIIEGFYNQSPQRKNIIFSYYKDDTSVGIWDDDLDECCKNSGAHASAVLPVSVYNQSYYSVVAETTYKNTYNQYTEKVAKPIIAKRPFVAFAGQHYLRNLKSLGFKTFDSLLDESYDSVEDLDQRMQLAWQQLEWLCKQDPVNVYNKLQPVLEHNFHHFIKTDWHAAIRAHLQ